MLEKCLAYIEQNLHRRLTVGELAAQENLSVFHFQRVFCAQFGLSVGEYLRARRMSVAAEALSSGMRVLDAALMFGYDSPEGFSRAFARFHGITPSQARLPGTQLRMMPPLASVAASTEPMEYWLEQKPQQCFIGVERRFSYENSHELIPLFWDEYFASAPQIMGEFGVCVGHDEESFRYLIADRAAPDAPVPEGMTRIVLPASLWAVFPCRGPIRETLQPTTTRIWRDFVPSCREYRLAGQYNVERYTPPQPDERENYCELWIALEKI